MMKALLNLLNGLAPLGVIVAGGWLAVSGETTVGVIIAFVGGFSRLGGPIRQLIVFYREAAEASVRHQMIARWMTHEN
jgi:ABC-type bacteriocin/lantibiotic exporter with double-glycine peptidase domain